MGLTILKYLNKPSYHVKILHESWTPTASSSSHLFHSVLSSSLLQTILSSYPQLLNLFGINSQ